MSRHRNKQPLSEEDARLWRRLLRDVQPLPGKRPPDLSDSRPATAKSIKSAKPAQQRTAATTTAAASTAKPGSSPSRSAQAAVRPPAPSRAPSHAQTLRHGGTLDKRTRQRLIRGQVHIEARLDLHGFTVEEAHMRLRGFIAAARQQGLRTVLVITGKGGARALARHTLHGYDYHHAPERSGRIRQQLLHWLTEPDMAEHIAGWQPAHPKHGGGGAFYIRLRRRKN